MVELGDEPASQAMWQYSARRSAMSGRRRVLLARSAYAIPADGRPFAGRHAHGRRNAVNRARRQGFRTQLIDVQEADRILASFGAPPRGCGNCTGAHYAAYSADDGPIALTHVHLQGSFAHLVHAVHAPGQHATDAGRYLLFEYVVGTLFSNHVRLLVLFDNYFTLGVGLRKYQRILGFCPVNLLLTQARTP